MLNLAVRNTGKLIREKSKSENIRLGRIFTKKDTEALEELSVMSCMECGCCSFVCPSNRPLAQINRLSKQMLREQKKQEGKQ